MARSIANQKAASEYESLLAQAEQHIASLQNQGISTRNLKIAGVRTGDKLRHDIDTSNTYQLKAYNRFLKKLINTGFERGYEGAALPSELVREYREVEQAWNEQHNRYWSQFATKPLVTSHGEESVTVAEQQRTTKQRGNVFGNIDYRRMLNLDDVKGERDLQKRIDILRYEMRDDYILEREYTFNKNILRNLHYYGSQELIDEFESLTQEQRSMLQNETLFVEEFFAHIPSDQELSQSDINDRIDSMLQTIDYIKRRS